MGLYESIFKERGNPSSDQMFVEYVGETTTGMYPDTSQGPFGTQLSPHPWLRDNSVGCEVEGQCCDTSYSPFPEHL